MSMITSTTWVRRGVAAPFPVKYELDEEEVNRISELAKVQLESARSDLEGAQEEESQDEDGDDAMDTHEEESTSKDKGKAVEERLVLLLRMVLLFYAPLTWYIYT